MHTGSTKELTASLEDVIVDYSSEADELVWLLAEMAFYFPHKAREIKYQCHRKIILFSINHQIVLEEADTPR